MRCFQSPMAVDDRVVLIQQTKSSLNRVSQCNIFLWAAKWAEGWWLPTQSPRQFQTQSPLPSLQALWATFVELGWISDMSFWFIITRSIWDQGKGDKIHSDLGPLLKRWTCKKSRAKGASQPSVCCIQTLSSSCLCKCQFLEPALNIRHERRKKKKSPTMLLLNKSLQKGLNLSGS
jgi:hypothetical protein